MFKFLFGNYEQKIRDDERNRCANIAFEWKVSEINNGDLTNEQLNHMLNDIGPNIAIAIKTLE